MSTAPSHIADHVDTGHEASGRTRMRRTPFTRQVGDPITRRRGDDLDRGLLSEEDWKAREEAVAAIATATQAREAAERSLNEARAAESAARARLAEVERLTNEKRRAAANEPPPASWSFIVYGAPTTQAISAAAKAARPARWSSETRSRVVVRVYSRPEPKIAETALAALQRVFCAGIVLETIEERHEAPERPRVEVELSRVQASAA